MHISLNPFQPGKVKIVQVQPKWQKKKAKKKKKGGGGGGWVGGGWGIHFLWNLMINDHSLFVEVMKLSWDLKDKHLNKLTIEGIFPLELKWFLTPFSAKNSFGWDYKLRSSLCTPAFHHTHSKDPDIHVLDGWMPATKTHPACTIHEDGMWLPQWLDYQVVTYLTILPKMVNPRYIAGECIRRRRSSHNSFEWT